MQSWLENRFARFDALADRLTTRPYLLAFGLAIVIAMLGFQYLQNKLGAPMLDMMRPYEREQLFEQLLLYGEEGRAMHARFTLFLDTIFPFIYGGFLTGLIRLASRGTAFHMSVLVVPIAMSVDWAENLQLLAILWMFPDLSDVQIAIASATTQGKMLILQFVFMGLASLLVYQFYRRLTR